jgi:maltose alpha-D-glucosyltransferase / alpha-amylase
VLACLRAGTVLASDEGEIRFRASGRLAELEMPDRPAIRRLTVERSHSALVFGEAVVLKLVRRLHPGPHPQAEMTARLASLGYAACAPLLGEVARIGADGTPTTLMLVEGFLRNQGEGWGWTLDWLARAVDEAALTDTLPEDPFAGYLAFATAIGRRLGELHAALARPTDDPAFAPETATAADRGAWSRGAIAQLAGAFDLLAQPRDWPDAAAAELARSLLARRGALEEAARDLAQSAEGALKTRVHGDFHLGQVLVVQGDAVIVDFEGEPARPLEERRAKGSPLRDVAGLLRSFDYAAAVASATEASAAATAAPTGRRTALIERWRGEAAGAFLAAYRAAAATAETPWVPPGAEAPLTDLFLLEKAAYEIRYEAANRPAWLPVPLRGLAAIVDRLAA